MQINLADCKGGIHCVFQCQGFKVSAIGKNSKDAINKAYQEWLNEYWSIYKEKKKFY